MALSEAKKVADEKWRKKAYDRTLITFRKDGDLTLDMVKEAADKAGMSLNAYITEAICEKMGRA